MESFRSEVPSERRPVSLGASIARFLGLGDEPSPSSPPIPAGQGSVLGHGLTLKGEVTGEGDFLILGRFEGEITLTGTVRVGPDAEVDANMSATAIVIGGVVRGNLSAVTRVEVLATGTLTGTLRSGSLSAAEGASVKGEVWVEPPARPAPSGSAP